MTSEIPAAPHSHARASLEWTVVAIGLMGGGAVVAAGLGYGLSNTTGVGAGFFPVVAGGAIALGSLLWGLQILAQLRAARATSAGSAVDRAFDGAHVDPPTDTAIGVLVMDGVDEEDDDIDMPTRAGVRRVALVALALVLGAVLLPLLGYVVTVTLMLFAVMTLVSSRKWWIALIVAVVAALASRFVFETLLGTALPHPALEIFRTIGL